MVLSLLKVVLLKILILLLNIILKIGLVLKVVIILLCRLDILNGLIVSCKLCWIIVCWICVDICFKWICDKFIMLLFGYVEVIVEIVFLNEVKNFMF